MRLISQDGMIDVPYDKVVVKVTEHPFKMVISALFEREDYMKDIVMGCYSTEAKAIKVMEMVRNAYCGKVIFQNVTIEEDVLELMKEWKTQAIISKTDSEPRIEYINNNIFVFPKDSEVEVQDE